MNKKKYFSIIYAVLFVILLGLQIGFAKSWKVVFVSSSIFVVVTWVIWRWGFRDKKIPSFLIFASSSISIMSLILGFDTDALQKTDSDVLTAINRTFDKEKTHHIAMPNNPLKPELIIDLDVSGSIKQNVSEPPNNIVMHYNKIKKDLIENYYTNGQEKLDGFLHNKLGYYEYCKLLILNLVKEKSNDFNIRLCVLANDVYLSGTIKDIMITRICT
jgi:hypothetical protein